MKMKRSIKILLILLGALLLGVLVVMANIMRSRSQVRGVEVDIRYAHTPVLVGEKTVADSVLAALPTLLQQQVKEVDCDAVAEAARRVPFLTNVSASVSVSGRVVVRADQRRPVARLFHGNRELYLDREGVLFPVSRLGNCNVLVAGGDFVNPLRLDSLDSQLSALWQLASFLDNESRFASLIDQIYIERDGDIMMVPKVGAHVIELGDAGGLDDKFANLLTFYRKGMPRAGWDTYSQISLKFKGQVVCTKK